MYLGLGRKVKSNLIEAAETRAWRAALEPFAQVDVCQFPEYHLAYGTRAVRSRSLLWQFEDSGNCFCYPFLLNPVEWQTSDGKWHRSAYTDITSTYGYSGPLSTSSDPAFLSAAWAEFDLWAQSVKAIAEFTRFSPYAGTRAFTHKRTRIEINRQLAVSHLPESEGALATALGSKTRNMIRKAQRAGLTARDLEPARFMGVFRTLYNGTMKRNASPDFFYYGDGYFQHLLLLPENELRLYGVFSQDELVAAAIALVHGHGALYHLGASQDGFTSLGANNLCLFQMSASLMNSGVRFLNLGGGRTTTDDDPLLRFKRSNATTVEDYVIGKRILDEDGYRLVGEDWSKAFGPRDPTKIIFYR